MLYMIEDVPPEVMEKMKKVLEVLDLEARAALEIQYSYPILLEGYIHDGNTSAIYSYYGDFNEIESRLLSYSRVFVPELHHLREEFAEDWQKFQVLMLEKEWVIKDLEEILNFLEEFNGDKIDEIIAELEKVSEDALGCYAIHGGMIV